MRVASILDLVVLLSCKLYLFVRLHLFLNPPSVASVFVSSWSFESLGPRLSSVVH